MISQRYALPILLLLISATSYGALSVSPSIIELEEYPGAVQRFFFSIQNGTGSTVQCSVSTSAMRITGAGLPTPVESAPRSCRDWITFEEPVFELKQGEGRKVFADLKCPRDTNGGYYTIISCESTDQENTDRGEQSPESGLKASMRFRHRAYIVVMLTVKGGLLQTLVEPGSPVFSNLQDGRSIRIGVPVRNRGNIHTRVAGYAEIKSRDGQIVNSSALTSGKGFLLPMHERLLQTESPLHLTDGRYVASVTLKEQGRKTPMTADFAFRVENGISEPDIAEKEGSHNLRVEPGFLIRQSDAELTIEKGSIRRIPLEIINLTKSTVPMLLSVMEWERDNEGRDLVFQHKPSHGHSGSNLISLKPTEFDLAPLGKRRVILSAEGNNSLQGDLYAAVLASRRDVVLPDDPADRSRRSTLVRLRNRESPSSRGTIANLTVPKVVNGALIFGATVQNTGDVGLNPDVSLFVRDSRGALVDRLGSPEIRKTLIQAGGSRNVRFKWTRILAPGDYEMQVVLQFDDSTPPVTAKQNFQVTNENMIKPLPSTLGNVNAATE